MKSVINGQSNELLFIGALDASIDVFVCEFIQLGSKRIVRAPIDLLKTDFRTTTFNLDLSVNKLQNATYIMNIKKIDSTILYSTTVRSIGNTQNSMSYIVFDSEQESVSLSFGEVDYNHVQRMNLIGATIENKQSYRNILKRLF